MKAGVAIFSILAGVAMVNIIFFSRNSTSVLNSVFSGTTNLFGTLTTNKG